VYSWPTQQLEAHVIALAGAHWIASSNLVAGTSRP
jgi:hypothetical protein